MDARAEYERRIDGVLDYVDEHLAEPLPLERLAGVAGFSPFHFHRIFRGYVGEAPHTFVRRRRLERAVTQIVNGPPLSLTRVAMACGFSSSSDFSRAFKQAYGFSPRGVSPERLAKESKIRQDLFANQGYHGIEARAEEWPVHVEQRPARRIGFVRVIGAFQAEKTRTGQGRLLRWAQREGLTEIVGMSPDNVDVTPMSRYRYDWCAVLPDGRPIRGVSAGEIPSGRWAVARCQGDLAAVGNCWSWLFRTWLPSSGWQPADRPALEVYRPGSDPTDWSTFDLDCCLPVDPL